MAFKDLYGHYGGGFTGQKARERREETLITLFFLLKHFSGSVSQSASQRAVIAQPKQQQVVVERHKNQMLE